METWVKLVKRETLKTFTFGVFYLEPMLLSSNIVISNFKRWIKEIFWRVFDPKYVNSKTKTVKSYPFNLDE